MTQQRDFITELEDAKTVTSVEMQAVVNRLPATDLLNVSDVAVALGVTQPTIYGLIQQGSLRALNCGTRTKPYYRIIRTSVLNYIKENIV